MTTFSSVTITKKANVYFNGQVTSRTITFSDGSTKTLGIMLPGEYEFSTGAKELMEILAGDLDALLPGASAWTSYGPGSAFEVPGQSSFKVRVKTLTDYCCSFLE